MNKRCEWRAASIETLRSARDVVGKVRTGHTYYNPSVGGHFVLYREGDQLMVTSEVQQVTSQYNDPNGTTFEFETKNSSYRVRIDEPLDCCAKKG